MNENMDYTMKFEAITCDEISVEEAIDTVYDSLKEKGYNPINQIIGYILSGDSSYITGHNNARSIIKKFERDEILEEIVTYYLNNRK
ncbi:MAG: IreB family regulatory phosphoprotein [Paraclostridium sp.]